jgi:hypothetical protein
MNKKYYDNCFDSNIHELQTDDLKYFTDLMHYILQ